MVYAKVSIQTIKIYDEATASWVDITASPKAKEGQEVQIAVRLENTGTSTGDTALKLEDVDTGELLIRTNGVSCVIERYNVSPGYVDDYEFRIFMPAKDLNFVAIGLHKEGWDWIEDSRYPETGAITISLELEAPPPPTTGILSLTSTPTGATVDIDKIYSDTTPFSKTLDQGTYKVSFSMEGYYSKGVTLEVIAGETTNYNAILELLPPQLEGKATIISFVVPLFASKGEFISAATTIRNDGEWTDNFKIEIMDKDTGEILATTERIIDVESTWNLLKEMDMPNKDFNLRTIVYHWEE